MASWILYGPYVVVIFVAAATLQSTWAAKNGLPNSNSDLEKVCLSVVDTSRLWGNKLVQFVPTCSEKLRGLGPKVLEVAALSTQYSDLGTTSCYAPITNALCSVQLDKYESLPGCPDTAQTFFDIVATCLRSNDLYAAHCPSLQRTAMQLIQDPVSFCEEATIREDGPEDPATGLPASFTTKTFRSGEKQDCQHIAMIYNVCRSIGVTQLYYPVEYCLSSAFPAYCRRSLTVVNDLQFRLACENLIVPAITEYHLRHRRRAGPDLCDQFYQKWLTYLAARKGATYIKSRAAFQSLQSTARPLLYINELKASIIKSQTMDATYLHVWDAPSNMMLQIDPTSTVGFPSFVQTQFDIASKAVNDAASLSMRLTLPQNSGSQNQQLSDAHRVNAALDELVALQSRALSLVKGLERLVRFILILKKEFSSFSFAASRIYREQTSGESHNKSGVCSNTS